MFNNLASYLLGITSQEPSSVSSPVEPTTDAPRTDIRLTAVVSDDDDDWVLVNRDSEVSDTDTELSSSLESIPSHFLPHSSNALLLPSTCLLTRTSSTSSLPCTSIEESWFLTPPPCFTSAGPINMETSPLENLLIEHPSMSVYQHSATTTGPLMVVRRNLEESLEVEELRDDDLNERLETAPLVRQEEANRQTRRLDNNNGREQCLKIKGAQKLQIQKACQQLKRGYIERNNKAREVNCRNHRQRRGERSQGAARSNANNNRKCC